MAVKVYTGVLVEDLAGEMTALFQEIRGLDNLSEPEPLTADEIRGQQKVLAGNFSTDARAQVEEFSRGLGALEKVPA